MSGSTIVFSRGEDPLRADKLNKAFSERVIRSGDTMLGPFTLARDPVVSMEAATKQYVDNYLFGASGQFLPLSGGTLTGALILHADPTVNLQAVTKRYVDSMVSTGPVASTALPIVDGTAAAGVSIAYSRGDHVHPTDTSRAAASAIPEASTTLPLIEGTAAIGVSTAYARADHVHPAGGGGGGASVSIADTPPATPNVGDMWWDSLGTQLYLRYNDGNTTQWVPATNQNGGVGEAAADGYQYARRNAAWSRVATPDVGRNLLHNARFTIAQRGTGAWTALGGYTVDRWVIQGSLDVVSVFQTAMPDAGRTLIGDEDAAFLLGNNFTGNAGAGAWSALQQRIENVRRLAGKTITVSFWANCGAGALKLGVSVDQIFGTGGSPSAQVNGTGISVTLSTTWTRYSVTLSVPSIIGKTVGTNNDHYQQLGLWYSSGATNATRSGSVGVQSGTINIWGVQLEIGTVATSLEKRDIVLEVQMCQRYYINGGSFQLGGACANGVTELFPIMFPVSMRTTPTFNYVGSGGTGYSSVGVQTNGIVGFSAQVMPNAAAFIVSYAWNASADL